MTVSLCFERSAQGAVWTEPAARRGWPTALMSPAQASPGLLLYFAPPATRTTRLCNALAAPSLREGQGARSVSCTLPSRNHRGVRGRQSGCTAERSKGGGMGEAHDGGESPDTDSPVDCLCVVSAQGLAPGHERSCVPALHYPSSPRAPQTTKNLLPCASAGASYK
jgi:hypothetical protein